MPWSFTLRDRLQVCFHVRATEALAGNGGRKTPSFSSPWTLPQLAGTLPERNYPLPGSPDFCKLSPRDTLRSGLQVSGVCNCGPAGLHGLASLKSYSLGLLVAQWLSIPLLVQETGVRSLILEDPMCHGVTKPMSHRY